MGKRILMIALALALSLTACAAGNGGNQDETVASMGEYAVPMTTYAYYFGSIRQNLMSQARGMGYTDETMGDLWELKQGEQTVRELLKTSALEASKEQTVLYTMAEQAKTPPDSEADKTTDGQVDQFLAETGGDEAAFAAEYFITPAQMKDVNHRINLVDAYYNGIASSITVTDEEAKAAYDANKAAYEQVTVRHILITTENMTDEQKADAKKRADDLLARIQAGEDIGTLAGEYSEDGGSKDEQGEYTFPRGQMVKPFEDWAFSAAVGDQGVVETDYGYHIMELMASASYESAKPLVEETLKQEKMQEFFQEVPELLASPDWVVETAKLDAMEP